MSASQDRVLRELDGLRALARALARDDGDDLLQDVAIAALEHPPPPDRPAGPWLVRVLRNRARMVHRGAARRRAREDAYAREVVEPDARPLDRARVLQRLAEALVALDEPFHTTVIRRYLDGATAADIAREQGVPAGTVRWRLKTGLERLRAELDRTAPRSRWQRALVPVAFVPIGRIAKGALIVKVQTKVALVVVLVVLALLAAWRVGRRSAPARAAPVAAAARDRVFRMPAAVRVPPRPAPAARPLARAVVEPAPANPGGVLAGRVVNWSTGTAVEGAELTFAGDAGAEVVRTGADGGFELAPASGGTYTLVTIAARGFLPYAPEYLHSPIRAELAPGRAIRGVTLYVFPALDYYGRVNDAAGAPVAGASVRLLDTPDQTIYPLPSTWTTGADGRFTFHAPDGAVLEATAGERRGRARLDGKVAISKQMVIIVGAAPARDAVIRGRVVDHRGAPVPDVLVTASPPYDRGDAPPRVGASATTDGEGHFELAGLDRDRYDLDADADGYAPASVRGVAGGARDVTIVVDEGLPLAGVVVTASGEPVPAYTLVVVRRDGAERPIVATRSIADPDGRFRIAVAPGSYDLVAAAAGLAPSTATEAKAGATDLRIVLRTGGTLRGTVRSAADGSPVRYARVMRESSGGGASAEPANAGAVTGEDGAFVLTGIPAGPFAITVAADGFDEHIEGGLTATDGAEQGPLDLRLSPIAPGAQPKIDLVGIGAALSADGDALRVMRVFDGSGAQAAGIVAGDHIVAVDGTAVTELGLSGAIARIRGVEGTSVAIGLRRGGATVTLNVERRKLHA